MRMHGLSHEDKMVSHEENGHNESGSVVRAGELYVGILRDLEYEDGFILGPFEPEFIALV